MKLKRILLSLTLVFMAIISLASCSLNGKPSYNNRVTEKEFSEKMGEFSIDMISFLTRDYIMTVSSNSKESSKTTELETNIKSSKTSYGNEKATLRFDKANNSLTIVSDENSKTVEKNGKDSNTYSLSEKNDMKIEVSSSTVRMIDNIKKTYTEGKYDFNDILENYTQDYINGDFGGLSDCRYYIDGNKYTLVSEYGSISSSESENSIAIFQFIIKDHKITMNFYEESVEAVYSDTVSSEEKKVTKGKLVIEHTEVELKKLNVSDYTLVE